MTLHHWRERLPHHLHTGLHEVTHWLYDPAACGRTAYRVRFRWLHVHLIPKAWIDRSCDRYDRQLGLTETELRRVRADEPTR